MCRWNSFDGRNKWYQSFLGSTRDLVSISRTSGVFREDRISILERRWTVREIVRRSQNIIRLFFGIGFGGLDHSKTCLGFHFEVKF